MVELPLKRNDNRKPPRVPVSIPDHVVMDSEFVMRMKCLGFVVVGEPCLSIISSIGVHLKGPGVTILSRGRALVNQEFQDSAMRSISEAIHVLPADRKVKRSVKRMAELVTAFTYLLDRSTASQRLILQVAGVLPAGRVRRKTETLD